MKFDPSQLHVFAPRANPLRWKAPHANWERFAEHMLASGVTLHVIECAYGDADFECKLPGVDHIGVRAVTRPWNKENLLNIGIRRHPEAKYIAWIDADVLFRNPNWAEQTVHALQHHDVVQPWSDAYDLGPNGEHMGVHRSFAKLWSEGKPVCAMDKGWWKFDGGPYEYAHTGYAWAMTRQAYDWLGGLFEVGGMGSGDHHMALAFVGRADKSVPGEASEGYLKALKVWEDRARTHINGNVGYVGGTVEHMFHGRKPDRQYVGRWDMFVKHKFDPITDLKYNGYGVVEWAGNKPELARDFNRYLASRNEDINSL